MTFAAPKSTLALFILVDSTLKVMVEKLPDGTICLPAAVADEALDQDLAFTCRRISKDLLGDFDYHLHHVRTFSGRGADSDAWRVNQLWAGIGRAQQLGEFDRSRMAFVDPDAVYCSAIWGADNSDKLSTHDTAKLGLAREDLRQIAGRSKIPAMFLPREFTLPEMRNAYEVVSGLPIDDSNFRRKVENQSMIREVSFRTATSRRPARTYELVGVGLDLRQSLIFRDKR
ncbi:hypothetical protein ACEUZ9_000853 [Paracoccus litorisediminis]|uniref:NrtR DNA-binding winged helix domain-containing protein n=1 Tax=Paracoccus litorisediminis TaxID=2006130 RepID=UPI00372E20B9